MSADQKGPRQDYSEQLSDFETQLRHTMDDEALEQDVFRAIRELLKEHQESEADIRRILLNRFEAGLIREETLQVVQGMLDRIVSEYVDTMSEEDGGDHGYASTDVLPKDAVSTLDISEQLQPGSILRDRFLLQQKISGGSMGVVYKALDRRLAEVDGVEPWVAIKVLTPKLSRNANALRAIQQEAAKGRCLAHPNIVRFIDLDRDDDTYFLVMEWIEGDSLAAILDDPERRKLGRDQVDSIVRQVADALDYAHRCGVVHADVKPGNVMVMPDGRVKLIDFGVARIRQQQSRNGSFDPGVLGAATPAYSSMQVLTGEDPVPADDVFSLACLAYRLIAGYRVFGPRNAAEAAEAGMSPQQPQDLDDAKWRALKRALSFARVTRYSSPREFVDEFLGASWVMQATRDTEDTTITRVVEPRSWALPAGVLAIVVAAVGAWYGGLLDDYLPPAPTIGSFREPAADTRFPDPAVTQEVLTGSEPAADGAALAGPTRNGGVLIDSTDPGPVDGADGSAVEGGGIAATPPAIPDAGNGAPPDSAVAPGRGVEFELPGADTPAAEPENAEQAPEAVNAEQAAERQVATHSLTLGRLDGQGITALTVVLREDGDPAVIDLQRAGLGEPLDIVVEELRTGGNGSGREAGQYTVSNGGRAHFDADAAVAQIVISMTSDPVREPDRDLELGIRDARLGDDLGIIDLRLEDDDQRTFEARLPVNTVGFAVSQVSVREGETAAQIDLVRYRPDGSVLSVPYTVRDVTATMDVDYFAPGSGTVTFEANSRSARILVPLVQDAETEQDETFFIELDGPQGDVSADIYRRIAVMIRDDDR